ncbi:NAD(P)H-hydrate dehydratase [Candidatus Microgenomates bacterium]|nr:NAD(P)H-hydrate dehydratase [Candidatus Microgenomates bacterium]
MAKKFDPNQLKNLYFPDHDSSGEDNGQITIIGGSELFHGAPLYAVKIASRIVDMAFFSSPEKSVGSIAENMKSKLLSFIWVPWEEIDSYIQKSDAVLIGPGFMRFHSEKTDNEKRFEECDEVCQITKNITQDLLEKFPDKKWVIDAGSLQTMEPEWIPKNAILTPNKKEFKYLFGNMDPQKAADKYKCILVIKGPTTIIYSANEEEIEINGGNPGLTKGGTGDVQAGLTVALLAKNEPLLSACVGSFITKKSADELHKKVGPYYNADDLADIIPEILNNTVYNRV